MSYVKISDQSDLSYEKYVGILILFDVNEIETKFTNVRFGRDFFND